MRTIYLIWTLLLLLIPGTTGIIQKRQSERKEHLVFYTVYTKCDDDPSADMTYSANGGSIQQNTSDLPWWYGQPYRPGAFYDISAQKHSGEVCDIWAEIWDDTVTEKEAEGLRNQPANEAVQKIFESGNEIREANSDSPYGIADASWSPQN